MEFELIPRNIIVGTTFDSHVNELIKKHLIVFHPTMGNMFVMRGYFDYTDEGGRFVLIHDNDSIYNILIFMMHPDYRNINEIFNMRRIEVMENKNRDSRNTHYSMFISEADNGVLFSINKDQYAFKFDHVNPDKSKMIPMINCHVKDIKHEQENNQVSCCIESSSIVDLPYVDEKIRKKIEHIKERDSRYNENQEGESVK